MTTLRKYLAYWDFALPIHEIPMSSNRLAMVCKEICLEHQTVKISMPDLRLLEKAHHTICFYFFGKKAPADIPITDLLLAPWVLYWPTSTLADSEDFLNFYMHWLEGQPFSRQGRICCVFWFVLLQEYPYTSEQFWYLCHSVMRLLGWNSKIRIKNLYESCEKYGLLAHEGAESFCNQVEIDGMQAALACRQIPPELFSGKFVQQGCLLYLKKLSNSLSQPGNSYSLQNFITNYEKYTGSFTALGKAHVMEALLLPFVEAPPTESEYKDSILRFLLDHFKDPRLDGRHWLGVSDTARSVIDRWLVASQLQAFFAILRETAPEQWEERQRFWSKYLERKVISRAWVALGREARKVVTRTSLPQDSFANLSGAQPEQSVLLMQINDLVIIEWTHSGSCRFCNNSDQFETPAFYKTEYTGAELRRPQEAIPHRGSWQYRIAEKIEEEADVTVPYTRYYGTRQ